MYYYLGIPKIELLLFKRHIVHCVHTICGVLYALCQASFNPWRHAMPVYWEGPEDADRQSDRAKCLRRRPPAIISDGRWPLRRWAPPLNRPMGHRYQSLALWLHAISLLQNKAPPFYDLDSILSDQEKRQRERERGKLKGSQAQARHYATLLSRFLSHHFME